VSQQMIWGTANPSWWYKDFCPKLKALTTEGREGHLGPILQTVEPIQVAVGYFCRSF